MPDTTQPAGLRILALVTDAFGASGGIAQYNRDLLGALAKSQAVGQIVVLPRVGIADESMPNKVVQLPERSGKLAYTAAAALAMRNSGPFDVIFCGHVYTAPLAALMARRASIPLWLQLHGIEAWPRPGRFVCWGVQQAVLVTAVSRHTRRLFLAWAPVPPATVKVLPNTVDERFCPGPKPLEWLAQRGLQGKQVLLTVSRLAAAERYKGHDRVIRAVAQLKVTHPNLVYIVAGDGADRPRLEHLAKELGVGEQVRFIGFAPDAELPDLYRAADIFVMPSTGEGFGIVFLQSLACGTPVVAGDSDGSRDPLRDGAEGQLVPAYDIDQLRKTISNILQDGASVKARDNRFARPLFDGMAAQLMGRLAAQLRPTRRLANTP